MKKYSTGRKTIFGERNADVINESFTFVYYGNQKKKFCFNEFLHFALEFSVRIKKQNRKQYWHGRPKRAKPNLWVQIMPRHGQWDQELELVCHSDAKDKLIFISDSSSGAKDWHWLCHFIIEEGLAQPKCSKIRNVKWQNQAENCLVVCVAYQRVTPYGAIEAKLD